MKITTDLIQPLISIFIIFLFIIEFFCYQLGFGFGEYKQFQVTKILWNYSIMSTVFSFLSCIMEGMFFTFLSPAIYIINTYSLDSDIKEFVIIVNIAPFLLAYVFEKELKNATPNNKSTLFWIDKRKIGEERYKKYLMGFYETDVLIRMSFIQKKINNTKYQYKNYLLFLIDDVFDELEKQNYYYVICIVNKVIWHCLIQTLIWNNKKINNEWSINNILSKIHQEKLLTINKKAFRDIERINFHVHTENNLIIYKNNNYSDAIQVINVMLELVECAIIKNSISQYKESIAFSYLTD